MRATIHRFPLQGKPLVTKSHTLPDRAEEKMTVLDWIKFIFINGLPNIPRFISNRPSVVDARLVSVRLIHVPSFEYTETDLRML